MKQVEGKEANTFMEGRSKSEKKERLEGAPLLYAPKNELGVVFLFSHLAKKKRLKVEQIRPQFPDCIAVEPRGKSIKIEFEFQSKKFLHHPRKDWGKCDWIVCWEHNWPEKPKRLYVWELRKEYGLGFNIWIMPVATAERHEYLEDMKDGEKTDWSVPMRAHEKDLILFYLKKPERKIRDIFIISEPVRYEKAGYKRGRDYFAYVRKIRSLRAPLFLDDIKTHPVLQTAGFIRSNLRKRSEVTDYWPYLFDMIVHRNPAIKNVLNKYAPGRLVSF